MKTFDQKKSASRFPSLKDASGSITPLFCIFAVILIGSISYSLYVGQTVEQKIALQNATDAAAIATANHAAQGLNIMAANNLAIGASIHIAGAVPILAAYISVAQVLSANEATGVIEGFKLLVDNFSLHFLSLGLNQFQENTWNPLAIIPSLYMRTAAGLTQFNRLSRDWWMAPAGLAAVEVQRTNMPDSLVMPIQKSSLPMPMMMHYRGMNVTTPDTTICHSIRSSRSSTTGKSPGNPDSRDSFVHWLAGPLRTIGKDNDSALVGLFTGLISTLESIFPVKFGFVDCGYGIKSSLFVALDKLAGSAAGGVKAVAANEILKRVSGFSIVKVVEKEVITEDNLPSTFLGIPTNPPEYANWEAVKKILQANDELSSKIEPSKYQKSMVLYQMITGMRTKPSNYKCNASDGTVQQASLPIVASDGKMHCIAVMSIHPACPLKDFMNVGHAAMVMPGDTKNAFNDWWDHGCDVYNEWAKGDQGQYENNPELGIGIADWAKQAKTYAEDNENAFTKTPKGRGSNSGNNNSSKESTLGFMVPRDMQAFNDSQKFLFVSADAMRTASEVGGMACTGGMSVTDSQGAQRCDTLPLVGLGPQVTDNLANRNVMSGGLAGLVTEESKQAGDIRNALSGSLSSAWSRAVWASAESEIYFENGDLHPGSEQNKLFWPSWKSKLAKLDKSFFLDGINKTLLGKGGTSNSDANKLARLLPDKN